VLVDLARQVPIVLTVEDVHWSDSSTRDFLTFLARGIRRERLALILTYRDDEADRRHPALPFLRELESSGRATRPADDTPQGLSDIAGAGFEPATFGL
jgi:predicted ATPase